MHMYYKAVVDIEGLDPRLDLPGLENYKRIVVDHHTRDFLRFYNRYVEIVNPKLEELNAEYDRIEKSTNLSYNDFMREQFKKLIEKDEMFDINKIIFEYEFDEECQFILVNTVHDVRMKCHLEEM